MEKKKLKLKLEDIKVESFITTIEGMGFAGGSYPTQSTCTCTQVTNCGNTCVGLTCVGNTCANTCQTCSPCGGLSVSYC